MQMVTCLSSAWALTSLRNATQLSAPSRVGHALAIARERDDVGNAVGGGLVDGRVHGAAELLVIFPPIQGVGDGAARPRGYIEGTSPYS